MSLANREWRVGVVYLNDFAGFLAGFDAAGRFCISSRVTFVSRSGSCFFDALGG